MFAVLFPVIVTGIFGGYISYNNPVVREYSYQSGKISEPVKLVILSDLHGNEFGKNNADLLQLVGEQNADAILAVGDFLNKYDREHEETVALLNSLAEIAPVYYALGNHEVIYMDAQGNRFLEDIEDSSAEFLELSYLDAELNGQKIRFGGIQDYAFALDGYDSTNPETMKPEVYTYLCDYQDTGSLKIMLAHRPESFVLGQASETWDVDLVISGHAHGGQVVLPFFGGIFGHDQGFFPEYVHGFYEKNKIDILISSGLGSGFAWVPRFNNPPEVVVLTLIPEK